MDLTFLRTIPGAIGGAVRMNAGCYGTYVADVFRSARIVTRQGEIREIGADALKFRYRQTELPEGAVAELAGQDEEMKVSFDSLKLALALAIFLVYVVMAVQFESIRYPLVELLTGLLWATAGYMAPSVPIALVWVLVFSGLVTATFVDFDCFEIPDEVSIGGMVLAPVCALLVPALHDQTWIAQEVTRNFDPALGVDRAGALAGCLAGIGFTMALFIANLAFKNPYGGDAEAIALALEHREHATISILLASLLSTIVGLGLLMTCKPRPEPEPEELGPEIDSH